MGFFVYRMMGRFGLTMKKSLLLILLFLCAINAQIALPTFQGVHKSHASAYESGETTFSYTGAQQNFTVPSSVSTITIKVWGAQGGNGGTYNNSGGKGGYATGDLTVSAGDALYVYVGGEGGEITNTDTQNAGGFNGGGLGGYDTSGQTQNGGGGGGASDVRYGGTALGNRKIVAGGGGGAGAGVSSYNGSAGGVGGGDSGSAGLTNNSSYGAGGAGGTQSSGGTAGNNGYNATNGSSGTGGNASYGNAWGSGGGGGGYYGGGGGSMTQPHGAGYSAGGGGGSGYIGGVSNSPETIAGNATMPDPDGGTMTGREGNGLVIISW